LILATIERFVVFLLSYSPLSFHPLGSTSSPQTNPFPLLVKISNHHSMSYWIDSKDIKVKTLISTTIYMTCADGMQIFTFKYK
jgi:hypothetical protein